MKKDLNEWGLLFKMEKYILNQKKKALLGIIDILILQWVKENPMSGQDIMNKIQKQFGIKISPGTMYPILFTLKERRLVDVRLYNKRKLYFLTDKGKIAVKSLVKNFLDIKRKLGLI